MFESEAKEYADTKAKKLNVSRDSTIIPYMQIAWQKGAEFGYNKANEWHYVKDEDLPKNNMQVLVRLKNKRLKISVFMENKFTIWNKDHDTYTKLYDVIAWKEIVLPEIPEATK